MTDDPITAYGQAWTTADEAERAALLEVAWAPDAVYCDPLDRFEGREALGRHIGATQTAMAGGRIAVTSTPVRHHDSAFFRWTMTDAGGATVLAFLVATAVGWVSVVSATALRRGYRSTRMSRFADSVEGLTVALSVPLGIVAAGGVEALRRVTSG